ncbi:unnamed protein product [Phaeothamnion confervicola]
MPVDCYPELSRFLYRMRPGAQALTYLDLRRMWDAPPFPFRQVEVNRTVADRFPTSWSVHRGHHFFLWNKALGPAAAFPTGGAAAGAGTAPDASEAGAAAVSVAEVAAAAPAAAASAAAASVGDSGMAVAAAGARSDAGGSGGAAFYAEDYAVAERGRAPLPPPRLESPRRRGEFKWLGLFSCLRFRQGGSTPRHADGGEGGGAAGGILARGGAKTATLQLAPASGTPLRTLGNGSASGRGGGSTRLLNNANA